MGEDRRGSAFASSVPHQNFISVAVIVERDIVAPPRIRAPEPAMLDPLERDHAGVREALAKLLPQTHREV